MTALAGQEQLCMLVCGTDGLGELRGLVYGWGRTNGLDGTKLDDLVMVVHEAAANAVRHGGGLGVVNLQRTSAGVIATVGNRGRAFDLRGEISRHLANGHTFRGVQLMDRLSAVVVRGDGDCCTVNMMIPLRRKDWWVLRAIARAA